MNSMLAEYKSSLADLTFNSKPLINMLTVLAEENYGFAADIVRIIESQVYQSPPNQRLPVLYLIDSIVKTYSPYVKLFSPNLIKTFLFVFEKAETKVRQDLFKLRSTWNTMFPKLLLHELDIAVKQFDPNWPIRKNKSTHPSGLTLDERVAAMISSQPSSDALDSSKFSSDEEEYKASYQGQDDDGSAQPGADILVEEEEILVDDEKFDELEALERALQKKKEELIELESLGDGNKPSTSEQQGEIHDLVPQPVSANAQVPYFIEAKDKPRIRVVSITEETEEPKMKRLKTEEPEEGTSDPIPGLRRISKHEENDTPPAAEECESPTEKGECNPLLIAELRDIGIQTKITQMAEATSQIVIEKQDQTTQYRYRKKTKNFLSQYRVPSKSVATYFRIKTKEAQTQYHPPSDYQDAAADSTSGQLEGSKPDPVYGSRERSALKDYISALKDDFLPKGYTKQSGIVLRSLYAQRRQGLLCDITLGAEGRVFKAHKSVLAASSDFFYTLFASEEIEKTPLSHIELQGITAKALNLILDYIYTSVLPMGSLSNVEEIIIAARRLQIHSLISTCPALEQAMVKKTDMAGWLISNSNLLSPSNKHPYVEAINTLHGFGSSGAMVQPGDLRHRHRDLLSGAGDNGAGDFICHVDRDMSNRKRGPDLQSLPNSYEHFSSDEAKHKKKKHMRVKQEYETRSETESDIEVEKSIKKGTKYDAGVIPSPGMPPTSWLENSSPKNKKKKKKTSDSDIYVYKCMNCERLISSKRNYNSHCEAHLRRGEKPYNCKLCKKAFWKEAVLESHVCKIHPELTNEEVVKLISPIVSAAEFGHPKRKDSLTSSPTSSGAKMKDVTRAKDYVRGKNSGPRECPSCKTTLQHEVAFARHMRLHHPDVSLSAEYQYQCNYCLQFFKTGAARAVHIKTHLKAGHSPSKEKKRRIKHPDIEDDLVENSEEESSEENTMYSSNQEEDIENLERIETLDSQDSEAAIKLKLYQCEVCGEMFSVQCFYKAHMAGHKRNLDEY